MPWAPNCLSTCGRKGHGNINVILNLTRFELTWSTHFGRKGGFKLCRQNLRSEFAGFWKTQEGPHIPCNPHSCFCIPMWWWRRGDLNFDIGTMRNVSQTLISGLPDKVVKIDNALLLHPIAIIINAHKGQNVSTSQLRDHLLHLSSDQRRWWNTLSNTTKVHD